MRRILLAASVLCVSTRLPAAAGSPAAAQASAEGNLLAGSLIEALAAVKKPELSGVFTYVHPSQAPTAFADLVARDAKAMKRYAAKLQDDLKVAGGATAWDHEVCATLVTYYSGPMTGGLKRPDAKRLKALNDTVLSPVKELQDIAAMRKR